MPEFYFDVVNFSSEDEAFESTVTFHSGNLTGLSSMYRKFCQHLSKSSGNIRVICNIVLPRVEVIYGGRYETTTGYTTSYGDREQQRSFYGKILIKDVEAQIELRNSDDAEKLTVTNLLILGKREVLKIFQYNYVAENHHKRFYVPFHEISGPLYQKCFDVFQEVFYGSFRNALERAVADVAYP
ncbi:uncharacterized protein NPIL_237281 [Nephila pilipes]|uniref:Uncharacterized protein n=1 Tax=Nephila pilipes TaxID=299642 RepID=A0A8X6NWH3_NEPPI|nr:uncharacterized protein NPIL_237281 [Nephila pilipes]